MNECDNSIVFGLFKYFFFAETLDKKVRKGSASKLRIYGKY